MKNITKKITEWWVSTSLLYAGKEPAAFDLKSEWTFCRPVRRRYPMVILARCYYQEFVKEYPLTERNELKQVLREEYSDEGYFHLIGPVQAARRQVYSFFVPEKHRSQLPEFGVFIPETLLLSMLPEMQQRIVFDQSSGFYMYAAAQGNTANVQSVLRGPHCSNAAMFSLIGGIPEHTSIEEIPVEHKASVLVAALAVLIRRFDFSPIFLGPRHQRAAFTSLPWKQAAIVIGLTVTAYLSSVSLYLSYQLENYQARLDDMGSGVNALLDKQQKLEQGQQQFNVLTHELNSASPGSLIWPVMHFVLSQDKSSEFHGVKSVEQFYIFRGKAARATAVLALMQKAPWVKSAAFDTPTRLESDKEAFSIKVELQVPDDPR